MYCRVDLDQSFPTRLRLQKKLTSRQPGAVRAFSRPLVVCESRFGFFQFLCSSFETVSFRGRITIVPSYPYRTHKGRAIRAHYFLPLLSSTLSNTNSLDQGTPSSEEGFSNSYQLYSVRTNMLIHSEPVVTKVRFFLKRGKKNKVVHVPFSMSKGGRRLVVSSHPFFNVFRTG